MEFRLKKLKKYEVHLYKLITNKYNYCKNHPKMIQSNGSGNVLRV